MGINGLLPLLKSIHKPRNLKDFQGKTLGVDAYGWLHRGTVACAMELAMGKPTRKFVDFSMHRVRMLQHFGVTPFIIFDGDYLPSKAATETDRAKRREGSRKAGQELLNAGKTSQAYLEFQKAVDVTPEMARQLIDELKKTGVQYIVAPYEADAQMVYLERKGIIDGILSEDSDLLVFGAKCLLTKLDQYGNCIEINKADFCACREISLTGWSDKEFRHMAILSGCDYLASISNMGLKTAYRMIRKHKTIEKVIRMLQFDGKFFVPNGYLEAFYQAELTFLHQRVFCPKELTLVLHTEPENPVDEEKMPFIGAYVKPEIAQGVACGDLNPITKLPIVVETKTRMAAPRTPWATSKQQSQRPISSNDLKKGKPIDIFFKPKRIPLGELDINCFTPSPSQQEALHRNTGPWLSSPAPRPYLNRATTDIEQVRQSAPTAPRIGNARVHIRTPTISEPRPPKRARLCADIETDGLPSTSQKDALGASRFFASTAPEPSPTVGRNARGRKSKEREINIFSDDSVDELMRNLPDADGFTNQACSKVTIFREEEVAAAGEDIEPSQTSRDSTPGLTPSMSATSSAEQSPSPGGNSFLLTSDANTKQTSPFDSRPAPTPKSMINLKSKFGVHGLLTPPSTSTRPSRIPLVVKTHGPLKVIDATPKGQILSTRKPLTPLQRLGANATNLSKLPVAPPLTPVAMPSSKSNLHRRSILSKCSLPFPEVIKSNKVAVVEPSLIPLPMPDETENQMLSMQCGSEDLIIHDSEAEDEGLSPRADEEAPSIDLGRFVYAG